MLLSITNMTIENKLTILNTPRRCRLTKNFSSSVKSEPFKSDKGFVLVLNHNNVHKIDPTNAFLALQSKSSLEQCVKNTDESVPGIGRTYFVANSIFTN